MIRCILPFVLAALIIASCTTAPAAQKNGKNDTAAQKSGADSGVKPVKISLPLKEIKRQGGNIVSTTYYTYPPDKKNPVKIETYDIQNALTSLVTSEKLELRTERRNFFDGDNNILRYYVITRNEIGKITGQLLFNGNNRLIAVEEFDYDEFGRTTEWRIYNGNESLLTYNRYTYIDENRTRIDSYHANGTLAEYFENVYDKSGNLIEESRYDKNSRLLSQHRATFRNGLIYREEFYGENKSLMYYIVYAYSDQYTKSTKTTFSADGTELEQIERIYSLFDKK